MPSSTTLLQRISTSSDHHHTKHHHHHHTKQQHNPLTTLPHSLPQQLHTLSPSDYTIIITHHTHNLNPNQATSTIIHHISAPLSTVWSIIRQFDNPLPYKHFLKSCHLILGDSNSIGSLREVRVISGLPAESSTERLEILDDERHVISFSVVGGQHRLRNYRSVTTLHRVEEENGNESTMVVESYVVDVPIGNTKEDTTAFADTIVKCNLQALAQITEKKLIAD